MLFQLAREDVEDLAIEVARRTIMFEDLNNALALFCWSGSLQYFLFKIFRAQLLDSCLLFDLLALIEVV